MLLNNVGTRTAGSDVVWLSTGTYSPRVCTSLESIPIIAIIRNNTQTAVTNMKYKWDHFDILAQGRSDTHCKIKETLLIREPQPTLKDNVSSEKFYIFYMQINELLFLNINLVITSIPNGHFWRCMSKHMKRQVKWILFSKMLFIIIFVTVCLLFLIKLR